jgi:hypothetical protein|nr:MAG TPA: hypothetical protein [Caudoviricetes sp.]
MKEILGNNLKQVFFILDNQDEEIPVCTFRNNRYEVWEVPDKLFEDISNMSEEDFEKFAGEDAWWRSSNGSVLYSLDKGEITINNQKMIGWIKKPWNEEISTDIKYSSLTEYLCEFIGASTPLNVVACAMDLAKFNHLIMGGLFKKYEPVED